MSSVRSDSATDAIIGAPFSAGIEPLADDSPESSLESGILLEVEHLSLRFGGLLAVDDLSFTALRGEITAIIGPNGAGKTTVFNCLTGFYSPDIGRLTLRHLDGSEVYLERLESDQIARRARLARTFQNVRLFPRMTVLENLLVAQHGALMRGSLYTIGGLFSLPVYRRAHHLAIEKSCRYLELVGLLGEADAEAGSLSHGAQRRLEIARALCSDPVLLCLDEPAAGLNPSESRTLRNLLRRICEDEGLAILLIEHDMGVVMGISDRIVVLDYGRKISQGTPGEVASDAKVIAAYLGEEEEEDLEEGLEDDSGDGLGL
ncbi:MAG: ABC transporter ATP-binding protein [Alphaproteobacteria bacterium]